MPTLAAGQLFVRQVEIMVRQARRGAFVAAIAVVLVSALTLPSVGWPRVALWATLVGVAVAARSSALLYIHRRRKLESSPEVWQQILTLSTAVLGLAVASSALLFFPVVDFTGRAVLMVILCSWPAGGAAVLGAHPRSYFWYLGLYFPTLALAWLLYEPDHPMVIPLMALFAYVLVFLSKEIGRLVALSATLEREKDRLLDEKDSLLAEKDGLIGELETARRIAEEANRSKSRFLAAASHDLRQPVMALSLLAGVLNTTTVDDKSKSVARQMARAIDSLEELFNAILDLSKLDAGIVTPEVQAFDLAELIQELEVEYRARTGAKGLGFAVRSQNLEIRTDRILLERIIRNLLENALKFTQTGMISLVLEPNPDGYAIRVTDTGPGIPDDEQRHIFEEFYQLRNPERNRDSGLGLGLAIVKRLVQVLGLEIRLVSSPGSGAQFSVLIPRLITSSPPRPRDMQAVPAARLKGRVITVIDDDQFVRDALGLAITAWGACPVLADTPERALRALDDLHRVPDLFIVDYRLQDGLLGTVAVDRMRERFPDKPAVILTGEIDAHALRKTGIPILQKPLSHTALGRYLDATLAQIDALDRGREFDHGSSFGTD